MPMPLWWGKVNKRIFNPIALRGDKWSVIRHVGRSTGMRYRTPLEAHPVDGGFVFIVVYGPRTDWVRNVLAAGTAELEYQDDVVRLEAPRMIPAEEAWGLLSEDTKLPPSFLHITDYLFAERASVTAGS